VKEHDENDEEINLETVSIGILEFLCKLLFKIIDKKGLKGAFNS